YPPAKSPSSFSGFHVFGTATCQPCHAKIMTISKLALEDTLAHENQSQAQHHDQPHAAAVAGEENDDVRLPFGTELFGKVITSEQRAEKLRQNQLWCALVESA